MNDVGSCSLIGSVASVKGTASYGTYGATKAAVRNLVRSWTVELKDRRIRSNVLSPGPIKTPLVDLQPPQAIARILERDGIRFGHIRRWRSNWRTRPMRGCRGSGRSR